MDLFTLANYGVAIFAVGVLAYLVKKFLEFMTMQEQNLLNMIKNHINHNTEATNKMIRGQHDLSLMVGQLLDFLKRNGK